MKNGVKVDHQKEIYETIEEMDQDQMDSDPKNWDSADYPPMDEHMMENFPEELKSSFMQWWAKLFGDKDK